jgi:hypothetical protein
LLLLVDQPHDDDPIVTTFSNALVNRIGIVFKEADGNWVYDGMITPGVAWQAHPRLPGVSFHPLPGTSPKLFAVCLHHRRLRVAPAAYKMCGGAGNCRENKKKADHFDGVRKWFHVDLDCYLD